MGHEDSREKAVRRLYMKGLSGTAAVPDGWRGPRPPLGSELAVVTLTAVVMYGDLWNRAKQQYPRLTPDRVNGMGLTAEAEAGFR